MRDLYSSAWIIPRFLGKRVIQGRLSRISAFRDTPWLEAEQGTIDLFNFRPPTFVCLVPRRYSPILTLALGTVGFIGH